jgi:hypothetical protein
MARAHAIASVVIETADQRGFKLGAGGRVIVPLGAELGLDRVEESTIEDGWLLAGTNLTLEDDLADVEPVAQKMGERAAGEGNPADCAPRLSDRILVTIPRWRRSAIKRLRLPSVR